MTTMVLSALSAPECHGRSGASDVAELYALHRLPLTRLAVLMLRFPLKSAPAQEAGATLADVQQLPQRRLPKRNLGGVTFLTTIE